MAVSTALKADIAALAGTVPGHGVSSGAVVDMKERLQVYVEILVQMGM